MSKWLSDVNILKYYKGRDNPYSINRIIAKYKLRVLNIGNIVSCIIQYNDTDIGYIQYYKISEDEKLEYEYNKQVIIYGIDLLISIGISRK